jgi:peptidoglycan/LPS O-acetylase OafA/YrhL
MWRIAPIYYFWIAVSIAVGFAPLAVNPESMVAVDARNIWMHALFLGFLDYKITNSLLGVEWSISIEVFWYIFAPLMLFFIRGRISVAVAVAGSFYWYWKFAQDPTYLPWEADNLGLGMHWSPFAYIASYCLGIGAFRLRALMPGIRRHANAAFIVVILLCAVFVSNRAAMLKITYDEVLFSSLITSILIVFGSQSSALFRWFFGNKVAVFMGTISYGIYLPQFLLLALLKSFLPADTFMIFLALCASSVVVSYVVYRLIEQPTLNFGTSLGKRLAFTRALQTP